MLGFNGKSSGNVAPIKPGLFLVWFDLVWLDCCIGGGTYGVQTLFSVYFIPVLRYSYSLPFLYFLEIVSLCSSGWPQSGDPPALAGMQEYRCVFPCPTSKILLWKYFITNSSWWFEWFKLSYGSFSFHFKCGFYKEKCHFCKKLLGFCWASFNQLVHFLIPLRES